MSIKDYNLLKYLVLSELKVKYHKSYLGLLWSLITPLAMNFIVSFIFSQVFNASFTDTILFIFSGNICWSLATNSIVKGASSLISKEGLLKRIKVNIFIIYLCDYIILLIDSLVTLFVLVLLKFFITGSISNIQYILLAYILLSLFIFPLLVSFSLLTVYLRDLAHLIPIGLQALYFLTPIIYKKDMLSENAQLLINFNPMTHFINLFRKPLYESNPILMNDLFVPISVIIISILFSIFIFKQLRNKYIFRL